ncbi:hypothetical protein BJ875DRAFT_438084 [Amylocarpus encephaloides]|uniref:Extracellular membrane protein CFEM domain-containing protein n=1 Tax=Amylocarpus encephaloides TaxID=45428 RepID=A0A9P8C8V9_9HELO|nr:hypothetical protein BJ875DRAFT_438084 [Amylocarpus encephaloides]
MRLTKTFTTLACLLATVSASAIPAPVLESVVERQSQSNPVDTAPLFLGACLAIGTCSTEGSQQSCYSVGCGDRSKLGMVCSCNQDVQKAITVQSDKGLKKWPVKCTY